jgi:hypothetical protein
MKFTALINQLKSIFDYSYHCASQHHYLGGCTKFWAFFYLSSSFLLLIICAFIVYRIHKENSELKNYLKNKAQRESSQLQNHA